MAGRAAEPAKLPALRFWEHGHSSAVQLFGRLTALHIQSRHAEVREALRAQTFRQYLTQPIQRTACAIRAPMRARHSVMCANERCLHTFQFTVPRVSLAGTV